MNLQQAIRERHSVRSYSDKPIEGDVKEALQSFIGECRSESGLNIQLTLNEEKAFEGFMAHYGKFSGVRNYIVLAGKKSNDLAEKCGYYGEKIVLQAQSLGLNTCWVAMTYSKKNATINLEKGEKMKFLCSKMGSESPCCTDWRNKRGGGCQKGLFPI